ncbi:MAG: hypothetical protein Q8P67_21665 [archaeon]|nr:hypothetical protein [archaeon]
MSIDDKTPLDLAEVIKLKEELEGELSRGVRDDSEKMVSLLSQLQQWKASTEGLRSTGIGLLVNQVRRKSSGGLVRTLSQGLVETWKKSVSPAPSPSREPRAAAEEVIQISPSPDGGQNKRATRVGESSAEAQSQSKRPRLGDSGSSLPAPSPSPSSASPLRRSGDACGSCADLAGSAGEQPQYWQFDTPLDAKTLEGLEKDVKTLELLRKALLTKGTNNQMAGGVRWSEVHAAHAALGIVRELRKLQPGERVAKARQILASVGNVKGDWLRLQVLSGQLGGGVLVGMSPLEMSDPESQAIRQANAEWAREAMCRVNDAVPVDTFQCRRCKERKVTYYQMQTRSADEPMTIFITCLHCGHHWRE